MTVAFASFPRNCARIALMLALIDRTMQSLSRSLCLSSLPPPPLLPLGYSLAAAAASSIVTRPLVMRAYVESH